ncbi:b-cell receptor-associated protein [Datura stramonium]|uniref:Endoplasmic reticulum transmembrane protein n=1 Tax=Datura stramonium TaxID=4076 RepID=A0ABS8V0T0_DATST|nr:b-cell receptor-associated protein [Datura stramonium]
MLAQVQLLFMVVFLEEMALILLFLFRTHLRKLIIMTLDRVKRGSGPLSRPADSVNPTDQILLAHQILEAALMGFSLFLGLMIDRLHHYIRELRLLRKTMEAVKKQDRALDNSKNEASTLRDEISSLRNR